MKRTPKPVIAWSLLLIMLIGLCGCKKTENTPETDEKTTAATEPMTSENEQTELDSFIEEDADIEHFRIVFRTIVSFRTGMMLDMDYEPQMPGVITYALECVNNCWFSLLDYYIETYDPDMNVEFYEYKEYDGEQDKYYYDIVDPLELIHSYRYARYPEKVIDWILVNIMGIMPDHTYNSFEQTLSKHEEWFECYYFDGYYYYALGDGGSEGENVRIDSYETDDDGIYTFEVTTLSYFDDEIFDRYTVKAQLHEVDGHREWKLLSIQTK